MEGLLSLVFALAADGRFRTRGLVAKCLFCVALESLGTRKVQGHSVAFLPQSGDCSRRDESA